MRSAPCAKAVRRDDSVVEDAAERPVRALGTGGQVLLKSYGTIDCGLELMHYAWGALNHKFAFRANVSESFKHDLEIPLKMGDKAE